MAKAAARGADRALRSRPGGQNPDFMQFGGYPAFVDAYNRLLPHLWNLCGAEAKSLFEPLDLGKASNPASAVGALWKTYLELAAARLDAAVAYLEARVPIADFKFESIIDLLSARLRSSMFSRPSAEVEVQNAIEVLLQARDIDYEREGVTIEYSSKKFIPDFTLAQLDLALEVKLCPSAQREKEIVEEINADIPAYQAKYTRCLFVVLDLGAIRDVIRFKGDIEANPNVHVVVVKW